MMLFNCMCLRKWPLPQFVHSPGINLPPRLRCMPSVTQKNFSAPWAPKGDIWEGQKFLTSPLKIASSNPLKTVSLCPPLCPPQTLKIWWRAAGQIFLSTHWKIWDSCISHTYTNPRNAVNSSYSSHITNMHGLLNRQEEWNCVSGNKLQCCSLSQQIQQVQVSNRQNVNSPGWTAEYWIQSHLLVIWLRKCIKYIRKHMSYTCPNKL